MPLGWKGWVRECGMLDTHITLNQWLSIGVTTCSRTLQAASVLLLHPPRRHAHACLCHWSISYCCVQCCNTGFVIHTEVLRYLIPDIRAAAPTKPMPPTRVATAAACSCCCHRALPATHPTCIITVANLQQDGAFSPTSSWDAPMSRWLPPAL
jgi:hypothetical protein